MKKEIVPILTEEYKIVVYIGTLKELTKHGAKYLNISRDEMKSLLTNQRGLTYDSLRAGIGKYPIIFINGDHDYISAIATIAHEASHAMDYIQRYLGIDDRAGEIHAHGVASVLRHTLKLLI